MAEPGDDPVRSAFTVPLFAGYMREQHPFDAFNDS